MECVPSGSRSSVECVRVALSLLISSWTQWTGSWTGQLSRLLGVSIGEESFSDLDYADDVTLLAEMLETGGRTAGTTGWSCTLGLQVNSTETKIQHVGEPRPTQSTVQVAAENVDLVDKYIYLGSLISHDGGSEAEILRRTGISKECFSLLEKNIWRSHILTNTKVHLYRTYILPVLLYGCETWTVSKTLAKRLDAFDTWCLPKFYGFHTPGTLQMIQSGASRAACQSLKRWSRSDWGSSGTWLDQLQRRTITLSSPPRCDHHLTGQSQWQKFRRRPTSLNSNMAIQTGSTKCPCIVGVY